MSDLADGSANPSEGCAFVSDDAPADPDCTLAELAVVADRTRARWAEELALRPKAEQSAELAQTKDYDQEQYWQRKVDAWQLEMAEHRKTCEAPLCENCDRFACVRCGAVRVERRNDRCERCNIVSALIGSARVPVEYAEAYLNLPARVRSAAAVKLGMQSVDAARVVAIGPAGAGKTSLVVGMATERRRRRIENHQPRELARFYSAIELGRARAMHRLGAGDPEDIEDAKATGLLLLDDVGAEAPRDSDVISEIIHARHDAAAPTWVTTALSPEEIASRYSGGIERRIFGRAVILDCLAGSKR